MSDGQATTASSTRDLLSKVSRYEALFELTGIINAATDIESVGEVLARRLKYIADVYAWRYLCFDGDPEDGDGEEITAIVIDGYRGRSEVTRGTADVVSSFEAELWRGRRTHVLYGDPMNEALEQLPKHFNRDDLEQISVNALVEDGRTRALYLFCRRRQPLTDLDVKCLSMMCGFFHRKVHTLWEKKKLRDLELAYLQQEVMLRESEKLATLGRLSAGIAHELNNPAAAASRGAEQLKAAIAQLEDAQYAFSATGLSGEQRDLIAELEAAAAERARSSSSRDMLALGNLELEVEDWLDGNAIPDAWEHASSLVQMGFRAADLEDLAARLDPSVIPIAIDHLSSRCAAYALLEDIGHGARRVSEIVKALKGYSFMDRAPVQSVDVREGLADTLTLLGNRLGDGIDVDLRYAEDLPPVQGYGSELNQVWTHLIDNAISAMEGEGTLELRAYAVGEWLVVEVADTGPGIPIAEQAKIFDPFYTTKAPGEGTGLGLSICHSIVVEKHRGLISVHSKPGETRFSVRLPLDGQLRVASEP